MEKLKKYPKYKPSGVEWIGEIPEEWKLKRLKYEVGYQKGKNPRELTFNEKGKPYLTMEYLRNNPRQIFFVDDFENYVSVLDNEILLLWDGSNAGEFIKSKEGILSSTMALLKIYKQDINYAWYFFKVLEYYLRESTIGMGVPHVNGEEFRNQFFILPPKPEQTAIAKYLDDKTAKIDSLIEKKKKLIELYKEERTAVINEAVTKGLNYDSSDLADYRDSKNHNNQKNHSADSFPKHWQVKKLKYVCKFEYGNSLSVDQRDNGNIPVFGSNGITGYHSKAISKAPCIIVGRKGSFGKINWSNKECFPIDTTYFIDIDRTKENLRFIYFLLSTLNLDSLSKDTGVPGLNREDAYSNYVGIPPIEEQHQIVQHIEAETKRIDSRIAKIEKEIELLKEYRTALISEVVTGKICVLENHNNQLNHKNHS